MENKIYTEKTRKLRQNTQKIANFLHYYGKIHSKLPIFRVKSVKIYTGQKNFTRIYSWRSWQISGMDAWPECLNVKQWNFRGKKHYWKRFWHCNTFFHCEFWRSIENFQPLAFKLLSRTLASSLMVGRGIFQRRNIKGQRWHESG